MLITPLSHKPLPAMNIQEAKYWADQIGAFEVHGETMAGDENSNKTGANKVMRMMVPQLPIGWSDHGSNGPMTLIGMREW